ncbi:MAG TPA: DUF4440 domain-containing protein [Gemmatimonadales bacterium]|nr:DUF4440 domain-containing protein [Gemmatimonadales bacterium]
MRTPVALVLLAAAACRSGPKAETESMGAGTSPAAAAAAAPAHLSAADEAAIREADQGFAKAASAGDAAALTAFYASDAVLMPPGSPAIKGSEEIGKFWSGMTSSVSGPFELKTTAVDGRGDLAFSTGEYTATLTPNKKGAKPLPVEHGKYLGIMQKQADGSWKLIYDTWNQNAEPKH